MFRFIYMKTPTDVEDRELIVLRQPSDTYFGIDLSTQEDLSLEDKQIMEREIQEFRDYQANKFNEFINDLGLNSAYRTFKPEKMVVEEK